MVGLVGHKIKGSTLLEVVIGLVLIMVVFGISTFTYLNIMNSTYSTLHLEAYLLLKEEAHRTINTGQYFDGRIDHKKIKIYRSIKRYQNFENLWVLKLDAFDLNNKEIGSREELIIVEENE